MLKKISEQEAQWIHTYEEVQSILRDMVPVLKTYYDTLTRAGFTEDQAMGLVLGAQIRLMGGVEEFFGRDTDPPPADR